MLKTHAVASEPGTYDGMANEEVKAIARQDESQGSKQKAVFVSKLDALFAEIQKWPISNFNHSLDKRITCVDPDAETAKPKMPEWMSNSVMRQLCTKKHIYEPRRLLPRCISVFALRAANQSPCPRAPILLPRYALPCWTAGEQA